MWLSHSKKGLLATLPLLIGILFMMGCGYSLVGENYTLGEPKTIFLSTFKNDTYEAGLEDIIKEWLGRELLRGGNIRISSSLGSRIIIEGRIKTLESKGISFNRDNTILEYRLTLGLEMLLRDGKTGKMLWQDKDMEISADYHVVSDIQLTDANKREALRKIAKELGEKTYLVLMEISLKDKNG